MSDNIANRDDALKCVAIARRALADNDVERATKFAQKAQKLYRSPEVDQLLAQLKGGHSNDATPPREQANGHAPRPHRQQPSPSPSATTRGGTSPAQSNGTTPSSRSQPAAGPNDASGTSSTTRPSLHRRAPARAAPAGATASPAVDPNAGTPEQRALVVKILKATSFYDILGVQKAAGDEDLKRAYKKLALKLHPDKNCAAGAEDAFKAVSKAFSCLSDPHKRAYYDRTGYESSQAASAAQQSHAAATRGGGPAGMYYGDDFDPEEIFNMFFGGAFAAPHNRVFRTQFGHFAGPPRAQRAAGGGEEHSGGAGLMQLLQLLPVLLIIFLAFFQGGSDPLYSLSRDHKYNHRKVTGRLEVTFYVKNGAEYDAQFPVNAHNTIKLERQIESDYYSRMNDRCQQERMSYQRMYTWGNPSRARTMSMPGCDELTRLNERLNSYKHASAAA